MSFVKSDQVGPPLNTYTGSQALDAVLQVSEATLQVSENAWKISDAMRKVSTVTSVSQMSQGLQDDTDSSRVGCRVFDEPSVQAFQTFSLKESSACGEKEGERWKGRGIRAVWLGRM